MNVSFEHIWQQVLSGDYHAWKRIVTHFSPLVYTVARRCGLSPQDAEDCGQYTWLMLFRHRHRINDPVRLPAWLIRTTRRRAARLRNGADRESRSVAGNEESAIGPAPDEEFLLLERRAVLEMALDQLDPRCAKLLRALFLSDEAKSYAQVAKSLGVTGNAFGPLRSRCLKRLRKILEEMGYPLD